MANEANTPENDTSSTGNEYVDIVNQVWDSRDDVNRARNALRAAKEANQERYNTEREAIGEARRQLNDKFTEASALLDGKQRDADEAKKRADREATQAFRAAVGTDVPEEGSRFY